MTPTKVVSIFLGAALALSAPLSWGQPAKKEVSYSNKEKAKQRAKDGAKAYDAEAYDKALQAFIDAYALNPEPKYLPPKGQCYEHLNQPQQALEAYKSFLEMAEADHPLRPEIEKRAAALSEQFAQPEPVKPPPDEAPKESPPRPSKAPRALFIGAAGAGALGAAAGVFALLPNNGALAELDDLQKKAKRQAKAALASDLFLGAALIAGVSGIILHKKTKKAEPVAVRVGPSSVVFSVNY